jgi:hypothetical protein
MSSSLMPFIIVLPSPAVAYFTAQGYSPHSITSPIPWSNRFVSLLVAKCSRLIGAETLEWVPRTKLTGLEMLPAQFVEPPLSETLCRTLVNG